MHRNELRRRLVQIPNQPLNFRNYLSREFYGLYDRTYKDSETGEYYSTSDLRVQYYEQLRSLALKPPTINPEYLTTHHKSPRGRELLEQGYVFASQLESDEMPFDVDTSNQINYALSIFKESDPTLLLFFIKALNPKKFSRWYQLVVGGALVDMHFYDLVQSYYDHVANISLIQDPILKRMYRELVYDYFKEYMPLTKADVESDMELAYRQINAPKTTEKTTYSVDDLFASTVSSASQFYLVDNVLTKGLFILAAAPKCGKSLLAYHLSYCVASGDPFLGVFRTKKGRVLYIQAEEPEPTIRRRIEDVGFKPANPKYREVSQNLRIRRHFDLSTDLPSLQKEIEEWQPSLVVFDTLRSITRGTEYSENTVEFGRFVYQLQNVCAMYNVTGLLIHHKNKQTGEQTINSVAGSNSIVAASDGVIMLEHAVDNDHVPCLRLSVRPRDFAPWCGYIYRKRTGNGRDSRFIYTYSQSNPIDPNPKVFESLYSTYDTLNRERNQESYVGLFESQVREIIQRFIINPATADQAFCGLIDNQILIPGKEQRNERTDQDETVYYYAQYIPIGFNDYDTPETLQDASEATQGNQDTTEVTALTRLELAPDVEALIRGTMRGTTVTPVVFEAATDAAHFYTGHDAANPSLKFGHFVRNQYLVEEFTKIKDAEIRPFLVLPLERHGKVNSTILEIFKEEVKVGEPSPINIHVASLYRHEPQFEYSIDFFLQDMLKNGSICSAYILRKFFDPEQVRKRMSSMSPAQLACLQWVDERLDVFLKDDWPTLSLREIDYYSRNWLNCPATVSDLDRTLLDVLYVVSLGAMGSTARMRFYEVKPSKDIAPLFSPFGINRKLIAPTLLGTNPYHPDQFKAHFMEIWHDEDLVNYLYEYAFPENYNEDPDRMDRYATLKELYKLKTYREAEVESDRELFERVTRHIKERFDPKSLPPSPPSEESTMSHVSDIWKADTYLEMTMNKEASVDADAPTEAMTAETVDKMEPVGEMPVESAEPINEFKEHSVEENDTSAEPSATYRHDDCDEYDEYDEYADAADDMDGIDIHVW